MEGTGPKVEEGKGTAARVTAARARAPPGPGVMVGGGQVVGTEPRS